MRSFKQVRPPRRWIAVAVAGVCLAAGMSFAAFGQDQSAATPKNIIAARKALMDSIASNMYPIDTMRATGKIDYTALAIHADAISAMTMAFPLLFPPSTNQWRPNAQRDPGTDTFADPSIWESYTYFYDQAQVASKVAHDLSNTKDEANFRKFAAELRGACDTCHAAYQKNN
jgi:cytochrome c556